MCHCKDDSELNFAQLKFTKRNREPFIACANHFSYKKKSCDLSIDLTISSHLKKLNKIKGINLSCSFILYYLARVMILDEEILEFGNLTIQKIKSSDSFRSCVAKRKNYESSIEDLKKIKKSQN